MSYQSKRPPFITCYSSDYEHSVEHWLTTRRLVEEAAEDVVSEVRRGPQPKKLLACAVRAAAS